MLSVLQRGEKVLLKRFAGEKNGKYYRETFDEKKIWEKSRRYIYALNIQISGVNFDAEFACKVALVN